MGYDTNSDGCEVIWEGDEIAGSGGRTQTNYYRYPDGSIAHLHYPGGHYIRHDYTARGQLAATGWDDDENNWWMKLAAYIYQSDGKVDKVDYGNGMTSDPSYDPRGFVSSLQHKRTATSEVLASHSYTRDTRDRIISLQKGYHPGSNPMENGRGDRFSYDEEGQLMEGWYNATNPVNSGAGNTRYDGFAYDALGNRTQNNYVASRGLTSFFRRDNGLNQYSSWSPSVIYHDDNYPGWGPAGSGVMMAEGWITASYNALNQPIAIWSPTYNGTSNFMWFGYDPLGRCVKRWVGDSGDIYSNPATYFHYDGWNLLQEGANAWGPARVYVHGNRVDEIVWSYNTFTGEQAFHHYDARGHATLLTGSSGNILEQYEYDAFGQPYFYDASGNAVGAYDPVQNLWEGYSQFGNRFLFTGREWIPDLKLYDYRNRMYQPELGRFLQPDPQEFAAGDYNLYRYCGNDPVNRNDPMGLASLTSLGGGDWDWFNGSVAAQMRDDIAAMTATAKLETTASAPKSDRPASDTSKSMRMEPAPDPKNPGHYLYDDYKYHRYYYPQLKDKNGRPQPGYNNYAQEVTTVRVNQCSWCPKGKFKVETTDGLPLHELRRDGTLPDRVGLKVKPTSNDNATLILDQRFKYQHGTEEPVMLKSGVTHETRVINGETTINYTPFVDP